MFPGRHPLGIEITDTHAKLCETYKAGKKELRIRRYACAELPEGTMNDGRIADESKLLQSLREVLNASDWSTRDVRFAIPSPSVMVRFLKLPNVSEQELRKLIEHEVKHHIHFPFDDPYYDFAKLSPVTAARRLPGRRDKAEAELFQAQWEAAAARDSSLASSPVGTGAAAPDAANTCEVLLAAASRELLGQYVRLFDELDLRLTSIEIKAFSLNRLHERFRAPQQDGLTLMADVNGTNCDLTIVQDGIIHLTRNVPVSFGLPKPQPAAETLDRLFADFMPQEKANADEAPFEELASELERLMNFYRYSLNHRDAEFHRIALTGDIASLPALAKYLTDRMSQSVAVVDGEGARMTGLADGWSLPRYAVPVGLCLRGKTP